MITDLSRDYFFGASDTYTIMMSFDSKTFQKWWQVKIGAEETFADNIYTRAGNLYEQPILDALLVPYRNEVFQVGQLRVNLDGRTDESVVEVKTHKNAFKLSKAYWMQCQVEMFASVNSKATLVAYQMTDDDYELAEKGLVDEIDLDRIETFEIEYDEDFILTYLDRVNYLSKCFEEEVIPSESDFSLSRTGECL